MILIQIGMHHFFAMGCIINLPFKPGDGLNLVFQICLSSSEVMLADLGALWMAEHISKHFNRCVFARLPLQVSAGPWPSLLLQANHHKLMTFITFCNIYDLTLLCHQFPIQPDIFAHDALEALQAIACHGHLTRTCHACRQPELHENLLAKMTGEAFSGGTAASLVGVLNTPYAQLKKALHPYGIAPPASGKRKKGGADSFWPGYNKHARQWTAPSVFQAADNRVVRRSSGLLGSYGMGTRVDPRAHLRECVWWKGQWAGHQGAAGKDNTTITLNMCVHARLPSLPQKCSRHALTYKHIVCMPVGVPQCTPKHARNQA